MAPTLATFTGDPTTLIYGSPETVAQQIKPLAEMGFTDLIVRSLVPDQRVTIESINRLADVRERVRDF